MIQNAKDKDRALARTGNTEVPLPLNRDGEAEDEDEANDGLDASKIIVIHPGSQNLRIGFANDALPKTIPMAIARKYPRTESEEYEEKPRRQKADGAPEQLFGDEFSKKFTNKSNDLKIDMRVNKRKVLPNSKELVVNYNRRTTPEIIPEHNDPARVEWTKVKNEDGTDITTNFTGLDAQRIPDNSDPKYKMFWPIQHGCLNENDYNTDMALLDDFESIIESALRNELALPSESSWKEYSVVFVIPDLYDKRYVEELLHMCLKSPNSDVPKSKFKQVAFIQESLAATYGAGYSMTCVVDIGAQKTSISCVEDGMIVEDSRINLKYGGYDVTEAFTKMMLYDHFPYGDINLMRRYDFLLAEELKINFCTMNQVEISVQLYNFHLRTPNQPTRKYQFKTYDEVILAPMGFFDPSIFDNSNKLAGRRKLIDRSYNAYDVEMPDDPVSAAQLDILTAIKPSLAIVAPAHPSFLSGNGDVSTPQKEKANPLSFLRMESEANGNSRVTSAAASPAPEGASTPGVNGTNAGSPPPNGNMFQFGSGTHTNGTPGPPAGMFVDPTARTQKQIAIERDGVLPVAPLDDAIITSIKQACKDDDKRFRDFMGSILVIGGGAKTPGLTPHLEERLRARRPDLREKIMVGTSPREMDVQVVVWKGASVFSRMKSHESFIGDKEYQFLNSRVLHYKVLWNW